MRRFIILAFIFLMAILLGTLLFDAIPFFFMLILQIGIFFFFFQLIRGRESRGVSKATGYNIIFGSIIFFIVFTIIKRFYEDAQAVVLSIPITGITYMIFWNYAGLMRYNDLLRSRNERKEFIDSIPHNQIKCHSCFEVLDQGDRYCANCGFDNGLG